MNKHLVKFLTWYIVPKKLRHSIKNRLLKFKLRSVIDAPFCLIKILLSKKSRSRTALIELNPFHIECLYSMYYYALKIDKSISVFTTNENIRLNLFPKSVKVFRIYPWVIKVLDKLRYFNKCRSVIIGSYFVWLQQKTADTYLTNFIKTGKPVLAIDHAPEQHNNSRPVYKNVHLCVLAEFLSKKYNLPAVYTLVFPESAAPECDTNKFLSVGVIGDQSRRDMDLYLDWLNQNPNAFSYIISALIYPKYKTILNRLVNVQVYEKASFKTLFECCHKSTFIPFLIHNESLGYYENAISGNLNLALAFQIIPVVDSRLAKLYGLDSEAAVIYNGKSDCEKALQCALQMSYTEICKKRDVLKNMYETLVQQAEQTIKNILLNTSDS